MKKRIAKALIALAASSMVLSAPALVSAEDNGSSLFSIDGLKGLAEEVWSELPDEDKGALLDGVQGAVSEIAGNEEILNLINEIPEEQFDMVRSLISQYLMGAAGEDADMPNGSMDVLTHDELLEKTGFDFPVVDEEAQYILLTVDDVMLASQYIMSEDMITSLYAMPNVTDISDAAHYIQILNNYEPAETTFRDLTAYIAGDEMNTFLAWIDEDNTFYGVSTMAADAENAVDEAAIKALADEYFPE